MAASLAKLRKDAKDLGIAASVIRSAESADELAEIIADYNGGTRKRTVVKKKVAARKTAPARRGRPAKKATATPKRRGRPPKARTSAPARSKSGTAKRQTTARVSAKRNNVSTEGRHMLGRINYSDTEGWNARPGSAPDTIIKALKKFKGDREKVFEYLKGDVWDFVGRVKRNGEKHTKASAEKMLKYRIARTDWDFAIRTGQHDVAEDRVEYGTGGTGQGIWKPAKKVAKAKTAPARRGRPPKSGTAKKAGAARRGRPPKAGTVRRGRPPKASAARKTASTAKRGPGRPKGSKNKTTARARGRAAAKR